MPLELTSAGRPVQLAAGTSVQLEFNSPLFDEDTLKGTFSYSFNVPAGPNGPLYGFPERPDGAGRPGARLPAELGVEGVPLLTGSQRLKSASTSRYSVNFQAGLSGAGLSERQLSSFRYGGLVELPRSVTVGERQVPGLPLHANEVVASPEDYGYVFAPLRNDYVTDVQKATPGYDPASIQPLEYPYGTVNKWLVDVVGLSGEQVDGSFVLDLDFGAPGGVITGVYRVLSKYCPFPRLRYVLQCVCEESGLAVDLPNLLPGELGDLVLVGNAVLVDRGDLDTIRFSLADVVPALTVGELLAAVRQDLGLVVYVDPATGRVRSTTQAERVAPGAPALDWSSRIAGSPEVSVDEVAGLTLSPHLDGEDELTKDLRTQQPDPSRVLSAVATVGDLPATALRTDQPLTGQVRLVRELAYYYSCTLASLDSERVSLSWTPLVAALVDVPVGGGGEVQEQATCYTLERQTKMHAYTDSYTALIPALAQPPYAADQVGAQAVARSSALRLLFYNGLQPISSGDYHYPQLSHRSASGTCSLRPDGEAGTYAQWLQGWLAVKLAATSYKQPLLLTPLDLARLDLSRPLHLAGVPYLVRKLSATVPLAKAATAELVRLF